MALRSRRSSVAEERRRLAVAVALVRARAVAMGVSGGGRVWLDRSGASLPICCHPLFLGGAMNARNRSKALLALVLLTAGCAASPPQVDLEAERQAALQIGQEFQAGMNSGNVDAVMALYGSEFF